MKCLHRMKSFTAVKFFIAATIMLSSISVSASIKTDTRESTKPSVPQRGNSDSTENVASLVAQFKYGDTLVCRAVSPIDKNKMLFETKYFYMKIASKSCGDKNLGSYVTVNHGITGGVFIKIVGYLDHLKTNEKNLKDAFRYTKEIYSFKYLGQFKSELYAINSDLYLSNISYDFGDHESQSYYSILLRSKKNRSHGWSLGVEFFPDGMAVIDIGRARLF